MHPTGMTAHRNCELSRFGATEQGRTTEAAAAMTRIDEAEQVHYLALSLSVALFRSVRDV